MSRAAKEYLATLDDAAFGAASGVTPKFVSPSDPATQWTGAVLGALALFVPSPMHGRIQAEQRTKIAPDENFEMHRFYCGLNGG